MSPKDVWPNDFWLRNNAYGVLPRAPNSPELMKFIPRQKEMTYLWNEMAKKRNQT